MQANEFSKGGARNKIASLAADPPRGRLAAAGLQAAAGLPCFFHPIDAICSAQADDALAGLAPDGPRRIAALEAMENGG